jgi:antitoxin YefM
MQKTTYSYTREHFSSILDRISNDSEVFCIHRKKGQEIIMLDKSDYDSLAETAYLLRSPKNAQELFKALEESENNLGKKIEL